MLRDNDSAPISAAEAKQLFADFKDAPAIVMGVSGGPDSVALMVLAARWRGLMKRGPRLIAVTVDHGLRRAAGAEARTVKALAKTIGVEHYTLRWRGTKPKTGLPSAARDARYALLARLAHEQGAVHVLTAHTRDDQAETVLMRMSRGSGLAGLSAMAHRAERDGVILGRPFLDVPKSRLVATLQKAGIPFATDPTNRNTAFTRPRLRALMPALAKEGCDARNLVRLAARLGRANTALETITSAIERAIVNADRKSLHSKINAEIFFTAPEEVRLRLLMRAIDRAGHEGYAELGKAEALLRSLAGAQNTGTPLLWRRTLAGAIVSLAGNLISVSPAPRRGSRPRAGSDNKP